MSVLALACLNIVHAVYAIYSAVYAFFLRFNGYPHPLNAPRRRIPEHLALLLTCDEDFDPEHVEEIYTHTLYNVARWSKLAGIQRLSVYDEQGVIEESSVALKELLGGPQPTDAFFRFHGNIIYPPTPPLSDAPGSRALTPEGDNTKIPLAVSTFQSTGSAGRLRKVTGTKKHVQNTGPLTVHLLSPRSSTPSIAEVARSFARERLELNQVAKTKSAYSLQVKELGKVLEGPDGFPAPDLMIVHHCSPAKRSRSPLELHGFPPWQVSLTEIYHDEYPPTHWTWLLPWHRRRTVPLDEAKFRRALDEFAGAEMRLGK